MFRLIFILVLLVVGFLLLKSWQRRQILNKEKRSVVIKNKNRIVRCEQCGLHVPEPAAVKHGGTFFCSLEHAQQAQQLTRNPKEPRDKP